jgi:hypothetical protein
MVLSDNNLVDYRHLLSIQHRLVRGLGTCAQTFQPPTSVASFLELYRFETATDNVKYAAKDGGRIGLGPLYYAAMAGNVPVLKALLALPAVVAKINLAIKKPCFSSRFGEIASKGTTPLLVASKYSDSPSTLQLLIQSGANPGSTSVMGGAPTMGALCWMAFAGSDECIKWWLDQKFSGYAGDIEQNCGNGLPPLGIAGMFSAPTRTLKCLVDCGATLATPPSGTPYTNGTIFGYGAKSLEFILSVGGQAAIDTLAIPQCTGKDVDPFMRKMLWMFRLIYYSGDRRW